MEKCEECEGTGKVECPVEWVEGSCKANQCGYCGGLGWILCEECNGTGNKDDE